MQHAIEFALAHPVYDPKIQIIMGHYFWAEHERISACLTVNLGLE